MLIKMLRTFLNKKNQKKRVFCEKLTLSANAYRENASLSAPPSSVPAHRSASFLVGEAARRARTSLAPPPPPLVPRYAPCFLHYRDAVLLARASPSSTFLCSCGPFRKWGRWYLFVRHFVTFWRNSQLLKTQFTDVELHRIVKNHTKPCFFDQFRSRPTVYIH